IGDYNGGGGVDLAVYDANGPGQVHVFLQGSGGFDPAPISISNDAASSAGDLMGQGLALGFDVFLGNIGRFDADGFADLLFGSAERATAAGGVDLFYGAAGPTNRA